MGDEHSWALGWASRRASVGCMHAAGLPICRHWRARHLYRQPNLHTHSPDSSTQKRSMSSKAQSELQIGTQVRRPGEELWCSSRGGDE